MNTQLNSTSQLNNDADVFAYRGQAARLRSEELRKLAAGFTAWLASTKAKASSAASNAGRQMDCEAC